MICLCLFCVMIPVDAEHVIVMSDDERILVEKNAHEPQSIASISKIMTAVLCLEEGDYIDRWKVGTEVRQADEKRIYLQEGQEVSMRSLLYGLMLESGNDAALVLAKRVGGSIEHFVDMMNQKAQELGMKNTVFHNPHGLDVHEQGNQSTCFDMALLMNYALKNEQFCEIIQTLSYTSEWGSVFHNSNKLLQEFPFCLGGKTGYTSKAGRTLVTAARNQDTTLICVTFKIQDHFEFHKAQYVECLNAYQKYTLIKPGSFNMLQGIVEVDEPFSVTCTFEELSQAEIRFKITDSEVTFQFVLKDYLVSKTYPLHKKKQRCFLGWCV